MWQCVISHGLVAHSCKPRETCMHIVIPRLSLLSMESLRRNLIAVVLWPGSFSCVQQEPGCEDITFYLSIYLKSRPRHNKYNVFAACMNPLFVNPFIGIWKLSLCSDKSLSWFFPLVGEGEDRTCLYCQPWRLAMHGLLSHEVRPLTCFSE